MQYVHCQSDNFCKLAHLAAQLKPWLMTPYRKPEKDLPDNQIFNQHVSMIHVRSKLAIGYLKGRFQSLESLPVIIDSEHTHQFANGWVVACIAVHNFALENEHEEHDRLEDDPFIQVVLNSSANEGGERIDWTQGISQRRARSNAGKQRREDLKTALFQGQAEIDRTSIE